MRKTPEEIALIVTQIKPCDNQTCAGVVPRCSRVDGEEFVCLPHMLREIARNKPKFAEGIMPVVAMIGRDPLVAAFSIQILLSGD